MNPITVASNSSTVFVRERTGIVSNSSLISMGIAVVGLFLISKHPIIGVPLLVFGIGNVQMLDCYTISAGNVNEGQTQCTSLISKMLGPM